MTDSSMIYVGGRVATMNELGPWAEAVVVRNDRIVFVGDEQEAREHVTSATEVVDLKGGMLLPGFVDSHDHLAGLAGLLKYGLEMNDLRGPDQYLQAIAEYARANPDLEVIRGGGWMPQEFPAGGPRREQLDAIVPDRPCVILTYDIHDAWFNTAAMRAIGLDATTPDPDPPNQYFVRDADGTPTGHAVEGAATLMLLVGLGQMSLEMLDIVQPHALDMAPSWGITTEFEAGLVLGANDMSAPAYQKLVDRDLRGELPIRIAGCVFTREATDDPHHVVATLQDWRERFRSPNLSINHIKLFSDGTMLAGGALMLEPFADEPHNCGRMTIPAEPLYAQIEAAHLAGVDMHIHVDADGSVRTVLDQIEMVQRRWGRRGRRHTMCHNTIVHPDDLPRYRELGVIANVQPGWGTDFDGATIDTYIGRLGEKRTFSTVMPYGDLVHSGAVVTYGADSPGCRLSEVAPLKQIEAAITRRRPGHPEERAYRPEQGVSLYDALRCYTVNGAYQLRMEHEIGSIEVGKKADLVALGADLFTLPHAEIHQVPVLLTTLGGRITHDGR